MFALPPAGAVTCPAQHIDRRATVAYVNDGDTFRLEGGESVRIVGVNAPEIGRDGAPDQPGAPAARDALRGWLHAAGDRIHLDLAREPRDDYGRLLAHAYLPDGRSIARLLLEHGHALQVAIPPNTRHWRCHARAERAAAEAGRGVWQAQRFAGVPAVGLPEGASGFWHVEGRIRRVGESRRAFWLELDGVTLRLAKRDLEHFGDLDPPDRLGWRLRARGWIYRARGEARMNLRHPAGVTWTAEP